MKEVAINLDHWVQESVRSHMRFKQREVYLYLYDTCMILWEVH